MSASAAIFWNRNRPAEQVTVHNRSAGVCIELVERCRRSRFSAVGSLSHGPGPTWQLHNTRGSTASPFPSVARKRNPVDATCFLTMCCRCYTRLQSAEMKLSRAPSLREMLESWGHAAHVTVSKESRTVGVSKRLLNCLKYIRWDWGNNEPR
jgi:hypothetical protein